MKNVSPDQRWTVSRRDFLKASAAFTAAGLSPGILSAGADKKAADAVARFGIVTDSHYADAPPKGSRFYRQSIEKMTECVELMNDKKVDFLIELGDFKDQGSPAGESGTLQYLRDIESVFGTFNGPRYHVLGNHDADSISKAQFSAVAENSGIPEDLTYYSFDTSEIHYVVLDANFNPDGSAYDHGNFDWTKTIVPDAELGWLERDLKSTSLPVVAFVHQVLDGEDDHAVNNAAEVRGILQKHDNVRAVFQGHKHSGGYSCIEGIHYYTLKAMIEGTGAENNSYAIVEVMADNSFVVTGWRKAVSRDLAYTKL